MRCVRPWPGDTDQVGRLAGAPPRAPGRRVRAGRRRSGARPPGARSLGGAAGPVTYGRPEHLIEWWRSAALTASRRPGVLQRAGAESKERVLDGEVVRLLRLGVVAVGDETCGWCGKRRER